MSCWSLVRVDMSMASATFPWFQLDSWYCFSMLERTKTRQLEERNKHNKNTHTQNPVNYTESVKLSVCWYVIVMGLIRSFRSEVRIMFFGNSRQMSCTSVWSVPIIFPMFLLVSCFSACVFVALYSLARASRTLRKSWKSCGAESFPLWTIWIIHIILVTNQEIYT